MSEPLAFMRSALERLARVEPHANANTLTQERSARLAHLCEHGYVAFPYLVCFEHLSQLQEPYRKPIEDDLNFNSRRWFGQHAIPT